MDKISVVIPTYNRCQFIDRAINSVLNQTYTNFEIIVVDDNGDDTLARSEMINKMRQYESNPRIKYIKNTANLGGALARNIGIEHTTGAYITFLDDDDEYLPTKIEVQYNEMVRNKWQVSIMDGATYNSDGKLLSTKRQKISREPSYEEMIVAHLIYHLTNTNTFMYEADSLRKIGGFDDIPAGQEYMLMLKTINARLRLGYIPKTLVANYVHNHERISTSSNKLKAQQILLSEKKKYFHLLDRKQRRQIHCRHHGVLFYVYLKRKRIIPALGHAIISFLYSPVATYQLYLEYNGKLKQA